jgi:hypothetical protein
MRKGLVSTLFLFFLLSKGIQNIANCKQTILDCEYASGKRGGHLSSSLVSLTRHFNQHVNASRIAQLPSVATVSGQCSNEQ